VPLRSPGRLQCQRQRASQLLPGTALAPPQAQEEWVIQRTPCPARGRMGDACRRDPPLMAGQAGLRMSRHATWYGSCWPKGARFQFALPHRHHFRR
jgi:hypothetical protein